MTPHNAFAALGPLLVPLSVVAAAWQLQGLPWPLTAAQGSLLTALPLLLLCALAALSWRFHRSGLLVIAVSLGAATAGILSGQTVAPPWTQAVALLAAANLALLILLPERGLGGGGGRGRLAWLGLQGLWLWWLGQDGFQAAAWLSRQPLIHGWSQGVWAALAASGLLLLFVWLRRRSVTALAGLNALALVVLTLQVQPPTLQAALWLALAAGGLLLALVQETYRLAFLDELTGLGSRRALGELLRRQGRRYAVAMVDVDHFKQFNDRYGHAVGDQVLRMVATRLRKVPGGGRAFRYGGEEFAVVFPGKDSSEAAVYAEALRQRIAAAPFAVRETHRRPQGKWSGRLRRRTRKGQAQVTVSIGVAHRQGGRVSPQGIIQAADQALYQAKRQGRNRVVGAG